MEILLQFGFMITNGLLTLVISWLTFKFKKREERIKEVQNKKEKEENKEKIIAIKDGIISLLRDRITQSCKYIENNGFITQQQITWQQQIYMMFQIAIVHMDMKQQ